MADTFKSLPGPTSPTRRAQVAMSSASRSLSQSLAVSRSLSQPLAVSPESFPSLSRVFTSLPTQGGVAEGGAVAAGFLSTTRPPLRRRWPLVSKWSLPACNVPSTPVDGLQPCALTAMMAAVLWVAPYHLGLLALYNR